MEPEQLVQLYREDAFFMVSAIAQNNPNDLLSGLANIGVEAGGNHPEELVRAIMANLPALNSSEFVTLFDIPMLTTSGNETDLHVQAIRQVLGQPEIGVGTWSAYFTTAISQLPQRLAEGPVNGGGVDSEEVTEDAEVVTTTYEPQAEGSSKKPCCAKCQKKRRDMTTLIVSVLILLGLIWIVKNW